MSQLRDLIEAALLIECPIAAPCPICEARAKRVEAAVLAWLAERENAQ